MDIREIIENYSLISSPIRERISNTARKMREELMNNKVKWIKVGNKYTQISKNPIWYSQLWQENANREIPNMRTPNSMKGITSKISRAQTLEALLGIEKQRPTCNFHTVKVFEMIYDSLINKTRDCIEVQIDFKQYIKAEIKRGVEPEVLRDLGYEINAKRD